MPQEDRSSSGFDPSDRQAPVHLTALAVKSLGQVYDMNLSAARVMMQTQARAASAIGLPDWSGWFGAVDERARHVFAAGAEQLVNTAQRASEAAAELQREVGRVVESQTTSVAETFKQGLQELGSQATEGFNQLVQTTRQQAEEAERVASSFNEKLRETMHQGTEQMRDQMRSGQEAFGAQGERAADAAQGEDKDRARRNKLAA
jgi:DNA anti-recombination protein RmuC